MVNNLIGANGITNTTADISFIVVFALLSVAVLLLAAWLLTKYIYKPKYAKGFLLKQNAHLADPTKASPVRFNFLGIVLAIMAIGFIVRIVLSMTVIGYREDFISLFDLMMDSSPSYGSDGAITQYPLVVGIYWFLGLISRPIALTADSFVAPILIKLPFIIADLVLIYILYRAGAKHINEYTGLIFAGIAALFPPFIISSSVWGSVYSLLALFLTLTFYFMANKRFALMFFSYALALFTAKDALYLFPILAVFVIYQWFKAIKYRKNEAVRGFRSILRDRYARPVLTLPVYVFAAWIIMWLSVIPLFSQTAGTTPFSFLSVFYFSPLGNFSLFGYNAMNVFNVFALRNGVSLGSEFPSVFFGVVFMIIVTALVLLVYLSRKNRANVVYLAAYILLTLSVYFIDFTAMNLVAVLGVLLLAAALIRDKRILLIAGLLGLTVTLNASFVMTSAGYFGNNPSADFSSALYTGASLLDKGGWLIANIICSLFAMAIHGYATIVILDIAMSNKRKLFAELPEPVKFGSALKKFFKD